MDAIVLSASDPKIGKISEASQVWPTTDVVGQPYIKTACARYTLPAPAGEHWFVVLPERFEGEVNVTVEKLKTVKVRPADSSEAVG